MRAASLRLQEHDRDYLTSAAAALGVDVSQAALSDFARYTDILDLWSRKMSLVSCGSSRELLDRHVLDSLSLAAALPTDHPILDLGSGAGFPGVPLAIVLPDRHFVLVESRQRRASFLREVRRTLDLRNVEVIDDRAEVVPSQLRHTASAVMSRAVWADMSFFEIAARWLRPEGMAFWMRSDHQPEVSFAPGFRLARQLRYRIGQCPPRRVDVFASTDVPRETSS